MDIRALTCVIIRKNGEYLVRANERGGLKWSTSPYDAWRTRNREHSAMVARKTGGVEMLFNPASGDLKML